MGKSKSSTAHVDAPQPEIRAPGPLTSSLQDLLRAQIGAKADGLSEQELDVLVADKILRESRLIEERYNSSEGVGVFLSHEPATRPKPGARVNQRFLENTVSSVNFHNRSLLAAVDRAAQRAPPSQARDRQPHASASRSSRSDERARKPRDLSRYDDGYSIRPIAGQAQPRQATTASRRRGPRQESPDEAVARRSHRHSSFHDDYKTSKGGRESPVAGNEEKPERRQRRRRDNSEEYEPAATKLNRQTRDSPGRASSIYKRKRARRESDDERYLDSDRELSPAQLEPLRSAPRRSIMNGAPYRRDDKPRHTQERTPTRSPYLSSDSDSEEGPQPARAVREWDRGK
ncbi:hypothetical protein E5Q_04134 [Mixia osmundae IAM 14324]|uniref:Uncharacterized protein n=1 Tax=Mixia osmundae (strain CBS 9802 / IAM 14324 / JCM 22182 / KY 12970) TaxID=764103 RepID=G7E3P5_MIXOS|nr:hypothetical protein E5Q_04134 [Mixia osmundae IAM 14324]